MRSFAYWSFSLCVIAAAAGCASGAKSSSGGSGSVKPNPRTTTSAQRAIEEADIIQVDGGLLYAMSKSGTVSIVDIATPGRLALLGQTTLAGEPFEMYRRGDFLITMSNDAVGQDGRVTVTRAGVDAGGGALVSVLDVRDPTQLVEVATLKVPGEIADSRVVGNVLYVASYENTLCYGCGNLPRTLVTTFNIASPTAIALIEQVSFESTAAPPTPPSGGRTGSAASSSPASASTSAATWSSTRTATAPRTKGSSTSSTSPTRTDA